MREAKKCTVVNTYANSFRTFTKVKRTNKMVRKRAIKTKMKTIRSFIVLSKTVCIPNGLALIYCNSNQKTITDTSRDKMVM